MVSLGASPASDVLALPERTVGSGVAPMPCAGSAMVRPDGTERFQKVPVSPRIAVGAARALYTGPGLDLAPHLNVATTLAVALDHDFTLRTWSPTRRWSAWQPLSAAVIPSQTLHHLRAQGPMLFLYLDPLRDRAEAFTPQHMQAACSRLRALPRVPTLADACTALGLGQAPVADARIGRVLEQLEAAPERFARLQDAAALACLSPSRFRARFQGQVGMPFRRYRLWRRMARVLQCLAAGASLTDAAHAAGFASSAHLSTAFKRMFGLTPSALVALGAVIDCSEDALSLPRQAATWPAAAPSAAPRCPPAAAAGGVRPAAPPGAAAGAGGGRR